MAAPTKQTATEEIYGYFLPFDIQEEEDEDNDEEGIEEDELMEFSDMRAVAGGANYCKSGTLKKCLVNFYEYSGRKLKVRGNFLMNFPWWAAHMTIRKTNARIKYLIGYPGYELRHDDLVAKDNVVMLFLKNRKVDDQHCDIFYNTVKFWGDASDLNFGQLPHLLDRMQQCPDKDLANIAEGIRIRLEGTAEWHWINCKGNLGKFFRILPQLMPHRFMEMLKVLDEKEKFCLQKDLDERPWIFGFSVILTEEHNLCGCEGQLPTLINTGLYMNMSRLHQDALQLYHALKIKRRNGNTYNVEKSMQFSLRNEGYKVADWKATCKFLEDIGVIVQEKHKLFLRKLWEAEMDIVRGTELLFRKQKEGPWNLNLDFNSGDLTLLRNDPDQMQAAHLISNGAVVVMSGKGGCGKTQVVSTVFQYAERLLDEEMLDSQNHHMFDDSQEVDDEMLSQTMAQFESECGDDKQYADYDSHIHVNTEVEPPMLKKNQSGFGADEQESPFLSELVESVAKRPLNDVWPSSGYSSSSRENSPSILSVEPQYFPFAKNKQDSFVVKEQNIDIQNSSCSNGENSPSFLSVDPKPVIRSIDKQVTDTPPKQNDSKGTLPGIESGTDCDKLSVDGNAAEHYVKEKNKYKSKHQEEPIILLTAPTGKAANLLGYRSGLPSFTLHQVIFSYWAWQNNVRKAENGSNTAPKWKFRRVQVLVVDECSLVSVNTFASLLGMLLEEAPLRKLVLLGDYRQLPSIEPGNFLADVYKSLQLIGCAVELRTNHRSESELIIKNATLISTQQPPDIDPDKNFHMLEVAEAGQEDYLDIDQDQIIRNLLATCSPPLDGHENSQFVAYRRRDCDAINELCCQYYSNHSTTTNKKKKDFRIGDKVCATKNADVVNLLNKKQACRGNEDNKHYAEENSAGNNKEDKIVRVCNGEIFFITNIRDEEDIRGRKSSFITLKYSDVDKEIEVDSRELKSRCKLKHAWARTIHTYQGSEASTVVYVVGSPVGQNWQHVYTAVTRGKKRVIIVARHSALRTAVKADRDIRKTSLRDKMEDMLVKVGLLAQQPQSSFLRTPERPTQKPACPFVTKTPPRTYGSSVMPKVSPSPSQRLKRLSIQTPEGSANVANRDRLTHMIKPLVLMGSQGKFSRDDDNKSQEMDSQPFSEWGDSFTEEVLRLEEDHLSSPEKKAKTTLPRCNSNVKENDENSSRLVSPHGSQQRLSYHELDSPSWKRSLFKDDRYGAQTSGNMTDQSKPTAVVLNLNAKKQGSNTQGMLCGDKTLLQGHTAIQTDSRSPKRPISPSQSDSSGQPWLRLQEGYLSSPERQKLLKIGIMPATSKKS